MHSANVDPPRPCSLNLASSDLAEGSEQAEDADSEANSTGDEEEAGLEGIAEMCALEDALATELEGTQDLPVARGDAQAGHFRRPSAPRPAKPFQKWMRMLHRRALRRQDMLGLDGNLLPWLHEAADGDSQARGSAHHRHSSSESSSAFVTAVKSASVSVADVSMLTRSRKTTIRSSRGLRTERSRTASISGPRSSEDSCCPERQPPLDPAVAKRALQRRRILEELISTEENYIGDVRFLINVYVTILASLPSSPACLRSSVNRNLTDIVELHEEILGELHRAVPDSEYTQPDLPMRLTQSNSSTCGHFRRRSLDAVPEGEDDISWLPEVPGMTAEPSTAAEVSKIFLKRMNRFFIYEEYGAKYELMIKDVAAAHRTMPGWLSYQKGLEILASSLGSADSRGNQSRKALTAGDLLVKPIQRVCRYPLLFSELLKYTPVIDCPYSHMEIENTLIRLHEANAEINRATNDSRTKSVLEKTWILQDRLAFPNQQLDAVSKSLIRSFGHIQLCGALHVCWQTKEGVSGQYMVALLYREWLCLATAGRNDQIYTIQACVSLADIRVEEVDNGRGLQCHTARHSWKIVFLSGNQLYELIMTACSPKEELEWCARLKNNQPPDSQDLVQSDPFSFLSLNINSLGTVFRKPGTIARRISIHRATTVGPKSPLYQVILKNTSAAKHDPTTSTSASSSSATHPSSTHAINRSQSLLKTNSRIPVLAPARAERARLEALLADVWTTDVLPFPGIGARSRGEHIASSMMRKLSSVSIAAAGGFARRSASGASLGSVGCGSMAGLHLGGLHLHSRSRSHSHSHQGQQQREKEGRKAGSGSGGGGGGGERLRRTSEGGYGHAKGAAAAGPRLEELYMPPTSLSGSGDGSDAAPDRKQEGAGGVGMGGSMPPRRASAPKEMEKTPERGSEMSDSRASLSSSQGAGVRRPKSKSSEDGTSPSSDGSSRHSSPSSSSDVSNAGNEVEAGTGVDERRLASMLPGTGHGQGQGKAPIPVGSRSRSRSHGLAGMMAKTGLKRREVVVEGVRSWFR